MATSPKPLSLSAVEYARAGWRVFPVDRIEKRPLTTHGHLDATTDVGTIASWGSRFDSGAIATPTGSGLLVIDVDPRNGGRVPSWAPATRTVITQSGGQHLHYTVDQDIKSRAGLFGPGVDSKSAGGYVLLPPSPGYAWENNGPRTRLTKSFLEGHMVAASTPSGGAARLAPDRWRRGIIHDQVLAWTAYFANQTDDEREVHELVWSMVQQAQVAGVQIDNARDHINTAIRWVLAREAAKNVPTLE